MPLRLSHERRQLLEVKKQGSEDIQPPESGEELCLFAALRMAGGTRTRHAWHPANPALVSDGVEVSPKLHALPSSALSSSISKNDTAEDHDGPCR